MPLQLNSPGWKIRTVSASRGVARGAAVGLPGLPPGRYEISDSVQAGVGPLLRPPDSGYRGADYDFITVETKEEKDSEPLISYTLDTKRARSEVRGQRTQSTLLRDLVATASSDRNRDQQLGRTLFNLLVPVELEAYLAGSGEMQIELDSGTAGIPWELLDTSSTRDHDREPWAIRVKLLRKMRVTRFREHVTDADADACVLVIGEPECPKEYPRLFGARNEAIAVRTCLSRPDALGPNCVTDFISADASEVGFDARTVVSALFQKPWRMMHISGHGKRPANGKAGGVVLSNGSFLGAVEIGNMRAVPELVFVNCCHLASVDAGQLMRYDRATFASSVAEGLIEIGVRCVIAAGWAVDDDAASVFAETFYESLLRGNRFIVAVGHARKAAFERNPDVNTWAAYQCYGDPDWIFRRKAPDANQFSAPAVEDFSGVRARADAERTLRKAVKRADDLIEQALALLTKLLAVEETMERDSLVGSAYKRRALVDAAGRRQERVRADLQQMKARYQHAQVIGAKSGASDLYYPASNCLAADVALNAGTRRWRSLDRELVGIIARSLRAKSESDADFWSVAGEIELRQYEALAKRRLASRHKQLNKAYQDLHKRVTATRMWASVYDTACLVLPNYADRATGKEKAAANELLGQLRAFAHPEAEP